TLPAGTPAAARTADRTAPEEARPRPRRPCLRSRTAHQQVPQFTLCRTPAVVTSGSVASGGEPRTKYHSAPGNRAGSRVWNDDAMTADMNESSIQETHYPTLTCFGCGPANPKGLRLRSYEAGGVIGA